MRFSAATLTADRRASVPRDVRQREWGKDSLREPSAPAASPACHVVGDTMPRLDRRCRSAPAFCDSPTRAALSSPRENPSSGDYRRRRLYRGRAPGDLVAHSTVAKTVPSSPTSGNNLSYPCVRSSQQSLRPLRCTLPSFHRPPPALTVSPPKTLATSTPVPRRGFLSGSLFPSRTFPRPTGLQQTPRVRAPASCVLRPLWQRLTATHRAVRVLRSWPESAARTPPGRSSVQNSLALSSMGRFGLTTRSLSDPGRNRSRNRADVGLTRSPNCPGAAFVYDLIGFGRRKEPIQERRASGVNVGDFPGL